MTTNAQIGPLFCHGPEESHGQTWWPRERSAFPDPRSNTFLLNYAGTVHGLSANLAVADLIPREGASTVRMVERWMRWGEWL